MTPSPIRFDNRMSDSDALMWFVERDPALRSTITSLTLLDRAPDRARLLERVAQAVGRVPRLRQRVAANPLSIAPPRWEADPDFDLAFHVRFARLAGDGSLRALLDTMAPFTMEGLDHARPLWLLQVVEGLEEGRAAMVMKLHHSLSDGVGLVQMMASLMDLERDGADTPALPDLPPLRVMTFAERVLDALGYARRRQASWLGWAWSAATDGVGALVRSPVVTARDVARAVGSVGRLLRPVTGPLSPLMVGRSTRVRFDVLTTGFRDLKSAARAAGGTLNDAFVAAVTGGLRAYHAAEGVVPATLRMTMPINVRGGADAAAAGNQFVPVRFEVPVGIADPVERMHAVGRLARAQRDEPALPVIGEVAALFNRFPAAVSATILGSMLKGVDFVTSNVPGPSFDLYLCGARIEQLVGFGPLTGAAANLTLFSYRGECAIGVATDPAAIPDRARFVDCLRQGLAEVIAVGRGAAQ